MIATGRHQEETPRSTYPLTALQSGMLFHHLLEPGSGVDIEQLVLRLPEAIDGAALRAAWDVVATRHDVLRTAFRWRDTDPPVQDVWSAVAVRFDEEDWRDADAAAQARRRKDYLRADRAAGFAMDQAPLWRVALVRLGEREYELIWTFHHAILDGRSFAIVLRDVFGCYEARMRGEPVPVPLAAPPFAEHVEWLARHDANASEAYWRERLRGLDVATPLPVAFPGEPGTRDLHDERQHALSRALTAALNRFAHDHGVTLNTLLQGAWALLLARHSGESTVVFGATRACRRSSIAGADDVAGLFINTLPLRVDVDPERPLGAWLRELRADWTAMRAWEQTPLPQVQRWSAMRGGGPLFESIVVFENRLLESTLRGLGAAWNARRVQLLEQTNFPLTLALYGDDALAMKLLFDRRRFDGGTIERILAQLATMLESIASGDGERPLRAIAWVPQADRAAIASWNATASPYPRDASIAAVFAARAAERPDATALVSGSRSLTYAELDRRANQLAHRLRRLGVTRDVRVGLCAPRSVDAVVGALGILKAGGAYVPLDPAYPAERLAFMVADAGIGVAVATRALAGVLAAVRDVVLLDAEAASLAAEPDVAPPCPADANAAAYIIYTSGSTGVPKGVIATHRGVVRLVCGARYARFGPDEVVLGFAPLTFDASTFEVWGALLNGGRLALFGADAPTLEDLGDAIRTHDVTTLWLTAALFHQMVDRNVEALRGLRQLLAGGDVLSVPHVRRALVELPDTQLINGYGPTENTTFTTCFSIPADWNAGGTAASVPIGRPVQNTTVYVLDDQRQPVPIGVAGRLFAGGDGVARGYHDRPELTAERFVPDPFAADPAARMYDTGDRARWRDDGTIDFLGRADQQLKIRGFRVEPGEIETMLMRHDDVQDAVVVGREDDGTKRLIGYAVARPGATLDGEALRGFLAGRLPAYLVPSAIVVLDAFPVTANGKVDRALLPHPDAVTAALRRVSVEPRTPREAALAAVWRDVLRIERVGVTDNFFELGGDSILTIAMISRAREAGLRITPRQLYDHPTIAELATAAESLAGARADAGPVVGTAPLTPIQRWFFGAETAELDYWNQAFLFASEEPLDAAALGVALKSLLEHHDALRLRFTRAGAGWTQRFAEPHDAAPLERVDLSQVADGTLGAAIEAACVRAQRSLDIERGPLVRALLIDGGPRGTRLFLAIHHLAVDGVSWRLLLEDLDAAYEAALRGEPAALPAKTTSFKDWAARVDAATRAGAFDGERAFWRAMYDRATVAIPRDEAAPDDDVEGDAATLTVALGADETRALLQRVPAAYNTQINDVLVAALSTALHAWAGPGAIRIHLEGHGREDLFDDVDLSRTVGWFTSLFPVRLELSDAAPVDTLRATKELLRGIPRRGIGYGPLREIAADPVLRDAPGAEIAFNYLGQFDRSLDGSRRFSFAPEPYGPWRGPRAHRSHALEIVALVLGERLEVRWTFGRSHRAATVERVAGGMLSALRTLIEACTAPGAGGYTPSDFPLAALDQAALDRVANGARDIEDLYPLAPIQKLFHLFADPAGDPGFEQWRYRARGAIDREALRAAWQGVIDRHAIFRTAFVSGPGAEPLQLVREHAALPWEEHDLRGLPPAEREPAIARILSADRARGFAFDRPPLMRMTLIRVDDDTTELVWSQHHLITDRWSWPIVLREVRALYAGARRGEPASLPAPVPYRAYIEALSRDDLGAAESFWRTLLHGYTAPPAIASRADAAADALAPELRLDLSPGETAALRAWTRARRVPLNTAIAGAWGLWLAHHAGADDVLVGLAVAGRPSDLAGVDRLVGPTINNLPLRVRAAGGEDLADWLRALHAQTLDVQHYASTPPALVQEWSGVPWGRRLFETMLVFHDAAADEQRAEWLGPKVELEPVHEPTRTSYPLTLVVAGSEVLSLRTTYDARTVDRTVAERALDRTRTLLGAMAGGAIHVGDLLAALPASERGAGVRDEVGARESRAAFVAPRSAAEMVIAGIWAELLGVASVGIDDDFFALGGQSLVAMQIVSRLRDRFQLELPVRALFRGPTVAQLTQALTALERKPGQVERIAQLVQRVATMSLTDLRAAASAARDVPDRTRGDE